LVLLFSSSILRSQESEIEDVSTNAQFWTDFNLRHEFDEKKSLKGFVGYRTISPHIWDKVMIVPTYDIIHTKSPNFMNLKEPLISSFHLGTGLYYTNNVSEPDNFEFRLMQGLKFFMPFKEFIPLKTYIRFEQRFQKTFDDSYWNVSARFRFKFSTIIEWNKRLLTFTEGLYIPISIEFFLNVEKANRDNDDIRISPGLGYKFNDQWKAEFYVSYHHSKNISETNDSSNDFVFRLRIYKSSLKKSSPVIKTKEEEIKELIE